MSNLSLKRIQKEYQKMIKDPSPSYFASPIKDDMFCWHFTIKGPKETEFEGGIYHGVIKLPMTYPNSPPSVMFLTPSGRFETNKDVCLSMTQYHKEEWQAAWTIGSMLQAIIAFMPIQEDHQAIGALNYPVETRKKFALVSKDYKCDICGPVKDIVEKHFLKENHTINENNTNENNKNIDFNNNLNVNDNDDKEKKVELLEDIIKNKFSDEKKVLEDKVENEKNEEKKEENDIKEESEKELLNFKNIKLDEDTTFKKVKSEKINYSEEFKKIRQSQYANLLKKPKSENIEIEKEENKILKKESNNSEKILNEISEENNNNIIDSEFLDEVDFNIVQNTIKFHGNKTKEEIENELNYNYQNKTLNNLFFKTDFKQQIPLNNISEEEDNIIDDDNDFSKKIKNLTYEKKVLEKFLKKKISVVKYCSRKTYEKERDKEIKNFTIIMGIIILLVFLTYYIFHKLF